MLTEMLKKLFLSLAAFDWIKLWRSEAATRGILFCNFIKKGALAQVFSCEFCEMSKNTFLQNTSGRLLLDFLDLNLVFQWSWVASKYQTLFHDREYSYLLICCVLFEITFLWINCKLLHVEIDNYILLIIAAVKDCSTFDFFTVKFLPGSLNELFLIVASIGIFALIKRYSK